MRFQQSVIAAAIEPLEGVVGRDLAETKDKTADKLLAEAQAGSQRISGEIEAFIRGKCCELAELAGLRSAVIECRRQKERRADHAEMAMQ